MDDINIYDVGILLAGIVIVYLLLAAPMLVHLLINEASSSRIPPTPPLTPTGRIPSSPNYQHLPMNTQEARQIRHAFLRKGDAE